MLTLFVGTCVCNDGFSGVDCSIDHNHVPMLLDDQPATVCDLRNQRGHFSKLTADLFLRDSVVCRVKLQNVSSHVK